MLILLKLTWVLALLTFAPGSGSELARPEPWSRVLSLMEESTAQGSPGLIEYLKSLTAEQMLLAARQACAEVAHRSGEIQDMPPEAAAELYVMVCLHYYFDKSDRDKGGALLLQIIANKAESPYLRSALIGRMWERDEPFDAEFQTYVSNHEAKVTAVLTNILKGREDDALVRKEAMQCLGIQLGRQVSEIIRSDPNMREALKEKRKHTNRVIRATELVRSGEVSLAEETMKALEPVEVRTIAYVRLLGGILADEENEPEELREQARRRLEGYRRSALMGIDDEVEEALRQVGD